MNEHEIQAGVWLDQAFAQTRQAMDRLAERLLFVMLDRDGQLARTAQMLLLKRGCRR